MAYKVNEKAMDFKEFTEQFARAQAQQAQMDQIQSSFSRRGIKDVGEYFNDLMWENQRRQAEEASQQYIVTSLLPAFARIAVNA